MRNPNDKGEGAIVAISGIGIVGGLIGAIVGGVGGGIVGAIIDIR